MTVSQPEVSFPEMLRNFIETFDRKDPIDRWIRDRLLERLHGEQYRRERERYTEWVDLGGEGGEG